LAIDTYILLEKFATEAKCDVLILAFGDFFNDTVVCNGNYIGYLPLSVPSYMYSYFTYLYMPNYVSWLHGAGKRYGWQ
jgi:hypothetical protein